MNRKRNKPNPDFDWRYHIWWFHRSPAPPRYPTTPRRGETWLAADQCASDRSRRKLGCKHARGRPPGRQKDPVCQGWVAAKRSPLPTQLHLACTHGEGVHNRSCPPDPTPGESAAYCYRRSAGCQAGLTPWEAATGAINCTCYGAPATGRPPQFCGVSRVRAAIPLHRGHHNYRCHVFEGRRGCQPPLGRLGRHAVRIMFFIFIFIFLCFSCFVSMVALLDMLHLIPPTAAGDFDWPSGGAIVRVACVWNDAHR